MEPTEHFGIYFGYIRRLFQSWVSPFNDPTSRGRNSNIQYQSRSSGMTAKTTTVCHSVVISLRPCSVRLVSGIWPSLIGPSLTELAVPVRPCRPVRRRSGASLLPSWRWAAVRRPACTTAGAASTPPPAAARSRQSPASGHGSHCHCHLKHVAVAVAVTSRGVPGNGRVRQPDTVLPLLQIRIRLKSPGHAPTPYCPARWISGDLKTVPIN